MSRRQTLAMLSPNQPAGKAAGAAGPGRGLKESMPGGKGRKSVAPGSLMERPSTMGFALDKRGSAIGGKASGPKQDPRPLKDIKYQGSCIQKIIAFLASHNYSNAVSEKALTNPSGTLFKEIITFLLQQIDPTFKIQGKVEDEVPVFLKRLNYPFQISKSALFAVGSPHTWPTVLGALRWLVELLEYSEQAEPSSGGDGGTDSAAVFNYIAAGYSAFMCGNDERCEALDQQQTARYTERKAQRAERIQQLLKAKADAAAELEQLRSLRDPVVEAQDRRNEQLVDKEKFEQLLEQLHGVKNTLSRKITEKMADLQAKQEEVAGAVAIVEQLRHRVASQTINKADLNRMILDRRKQKELFDTEKARCAEMEIKVHDLDVQVNQCLTGLEDAVDRYNKMARRLKIVPATSDRAKGINFELRINRGAMTQSELSSLDLKSGVRPALDRLAADYRMQASQLDSDLVTLRDTLAAKQERNAENHEQMAALRTQIAELEARLQLSKETLEEKSRRMMAQADTIKAEVDEHRNKASRLDESLEERLARAKASYEQTKRDAEAELARWDSDMKRALQMISDHKTFMSATLRRTADAVAAIKAEVMAMLATGELVLKAGGLP